MFKVFCKKRKIYKKQGLIWTFLFKMQDFININTTRRSCWQVEIQSMPISNNLSISRLTIILMMLMLKIYTMICKFDFHILPLS